MAHRQTTMIWLPTPSATLPEALSRPMCLRPAKLCTCFDPGTCDDHHVEHTPLLDSLPHFPPATTYTPANLQPSYNACCSAVSPYSSPQPQAELLTLPLGLHHLPPKGGFICSHLDYELREGTVLAPTRDAICDYRVLKQRGGAAKLFLENVK